MRRLEVERIDEVPAGTAGDLGGYRASPASAWVGAGDAASGPQSLPANPRRWPAARAAGLVWRLRAVPRTHGTRAASGLRPAGYYGPPARSSLTVEVQALTAKRGPTPVLVSREARAIATSGAPRGERAVHSARAAQAASGCACRRSAPLAFSREESTRQGQARCPKLPTPGRRSFARAACVSIIIDPRAAATFQEARPLLAC